MTLGPNCPIGNGPILASIEAEVDYMIKMMSKMQKENLKSFEVNSDAVRDFNQWKDEWMKESSRSPSLFAHGSVGRRSADMTFLLSLG